MKIPKIRLVKIKDIKTAVYNPPGRAAKAPNSSLSKSIEEDGLQYPLLITKENELVDGHRRLACLKSLGWEEIPCIETNTTQAKAYSAVNTTPMKMSGNDILHLYFNSGVEALTTVQKGKVERAIEAIGEELVKEIYENDFSLDIVRFADRASKYSGKDSKRFTQHCVRWIMKFGTVTIRRALDMGVAAQTISDAVLDKKPLVLRVQAED